MYNIIGYAIYILCQQLFIFPYIGRDLNHADEFGVFVSLLAIINIFSSGIGSSLGDVRVISRDKDQNNDVGFQILIIILLAISLIIFICVSFIYFKLSLTVSFLISIWAIFSIYRSYIISEFIKRKLFNYIFMSLFFYFVGCLFGLAFYNYFFHNFVIIFIFSELLSFIFYFNKSIYKFEKINFKKLSKVNRNIFIEISSSTFFSYATNSIDKILIPIVLSPGLLATYFSISVSSKIISMITGPLSRVILGWTDSFNSFINKKRFFKFIIVLNLLFFVVFSFSYISTPYLVKLLYPSYKEYIQLYLFIVSINGALLVLSSLLDPFFIRVVGTKNLAKINFFKLLLFSSIGVYIAKNFKIIGFAYFIGIIELFTIIIKLILMSKDIKKGELNGN